MTSIEHIKKQAKNLKRILPVFIKQDVFDLNLATCQELIAQIHGFPNWHAITNRQEAPNNKVLERVKLVVSMHPSGNLTLTEQMLSDRMPKDCQGNLFANNNDAEFYKAVAQKLADLHKVGVSFIYQDLTKENLDKKMYQVINDVIELCNGYASDKPLEDYLNALNKQIVQRLVSLMYMGRDYIHDPSQCTEITASAEYLRGLNFDTHAECVKVMVSKKVALGKYLTTIVLASRHLSVDLNYYK